MHTSTGDQNNESAVSSRIDAGSPVADADELSKTLHRFALTMASAFDIDEVLDALCASTAKILDVYGAGVSIEESGRLEFITATDPRIVEVEHVQARLQAGPCVEAYRSGEVFPVDDLSDAEQWPEYHAAARDAGLAAMLGVPLVVGDVRVGSMNVFSTEPRRWTASDLQTVKIIADVATAYLVHARRSVEAQRLASSAAASELRFRSMVEPSPDPVIRVGADGVVLAANLATYDLVGVDALGAAEEGLVGVALVDLAALHPVLSAVIEHWPLLADMAGPRARERIAVGSGDRRTYFRARFVPVRDGGGPDEVLVVLTDVTADVEREYLLEQLALSDALTGLANRAAITDRLQVALGRLRRSDVEHDGVAAMVVDLDYFKAINDAFGHAAGDDVLRAVAVALTDAVRDVDSIGRMGGDEFIVVCESVADEAVAEMLATRVADALDPLVVEFDDATFDVTGSVGVAWSPEAVDAGHLLARADRAMLGAKGRRGARRVALDRAGSDPGISAGVLARDAFGALDRDEFELYYQPIVDCGGAIRAAEALLRWNHPRLGVLMPGAFLAVIMESGAIGPVGRWVVRSAVEQAKRWVEMGASLDVHVNLSTVELSSGAIEVLADCLVGVDPSRICVEVTEHAFVGSILSSNSIQRLGDLGVQIALDDFGTGAATLSHLRQRPLHTIKLDRAFVQSIDATPAEAQTDRVILEGIIYMANALGLRLVAEGVETLQQLNSLCEAGCDLIQGWAFGHAVPARNFDPHATLRAVPVATT